MQFEYLTTERMQLRILTQEVYDYIYEHFTEPEQIGFLGLKSSGALLREKKKYEQGLSTHNRKFIFFQMLDLKTKKVFGSCGFHTWYTDHARAEIGYGITDEEYLRKGLMSEALKPILQYGFEKMNLHRIEALISPNNIPSLKLVKKMNFVKEGFLREHYFTNNRHEDSVMYALLRKDFDS